MPTGVSHLLGTNLPGRDDPSLIRMGLAKFTRIVRPKSSDSFYRGQIKNKAHHRVKTHHVPSADLYREQGWLSLPPSEHCGGPATQELHGDHRQQQPRQQSRVRHNSPSTRPTSAASPSTRSRSCPRLFAAPGQGQPCPSRDELRAVRQSRPRTMLSMAAAASCVKSNRTPLKPLLSLPLKEEAWAHKVGAAHWRTSAEGCSPKPRIPQSCGNQRASHLNRGLETLMGISSTASP